MGKFPKFIVGQGTFLFTGLAILLWIFLGLQQGHGVQFGFEDWVQFIRAHRFQNS
jgi:hypothetical protein